MDDEVVAEADETLRGLDADRRCCHMGTRPLWFVGNAGRYHLAECRASLTGRGFSSSRVGIIPLRLGGKILYKLISIPITIKRGH